MRKLYVMAILGIASFLTACGGSKQIVNESYDNNSRSPFGDVVEAPCQIYDTKQEYTGWGAFRGSRNQMGDIHINATESAKNNVRQKVKAAYKGLIISYRNSYGNNMGNDIENKMEMAVDQALDNILNDVETECSRWDQVEDDGHVYNYVSIRISKEEVATKTASLVEDKLTEDEKLRIDFKEARFREEMQKRFEQFKDGNN